MPCHHGYARSSKSQTDFIGLFFHSCVFSLYSLLIIRQFKLICYRDLLYWNKERDKMQNTLIVWPPLVVVALNNRIECLCQRPALGAETRPGGSSSGSSSHCYRRLPAEPFSRCIFFYPKQTHECSECRYLPLRSR